MAESTPPTEQIDQTDEQPRPASPAEQARGYLVAPDPEPAPAPPRSAWFGIFAGMIERGACSQGVLDGAHAGWRRLDDAEHAELVQMLRDSLTSPEVPAETST